MAIQRKSYVWQVTSASLLVGQVGASAVVGPQSMRPAIEIQYDDTLVDVADLDFYMASIGLVPGTGRIAYDPMVTPTDAPKGAFVVDANGDWWRKRDDGSTLNLDLITDPTEVIELLPLPEGPVTTGNGIFIATTSLVGGAYLIPRRCQVNRLIFRCTSQTGAPTGRFLLYQAPGGASRNSSNLVNLIGQITGFAVPAAGSFVAPFDAGALVTIQKGLLYVLWGRETGGATSITLRTYDMANTELFTVNVDADTHPVMFTTTIPASGTPAATFDPRNSPPGAAIESGVAEPGPVIRFKKV